MGLGLVELDLTVPTRGPSSLTSSRGPLRSNFGPDLWGRDSVIVGLKTQHPFRCPLTECSVLLLVPDHRSGPRGGVIGSDGAGRPTTLFGASVGGSGGVRSLHTVLSRPRRQTVWEEETNGAKWPGGGDTRSQKGTYFTHGTTLDGSSQSHSEGSGPPQFTSCLFVTLGTRSPSDSQTPGNVARETSVQETAMPGG